MSGFRRAFYRAWVHGALAGLMLLSGGALARSAAPASAPALPTLAVLPFAYQTSAEQALAERMRFAVSEKLTRSGQFDRKDNVAVEQMMSALQISAATPISDDDRARITGALGVDRVITGAIHGRDLTLALYSPTALLRTAKTTIPPDNESPKLAVEGILHTLTDTTFQHIRELEVDHSNPAHERAFAAGKNLVTDGDFQQALTAPDHRAPAWVIMLDATEIHPPVLPAAKVATLGENKGAIIQPAKGKPYLLLRMSKGVAESNGLACESVWIPVEQGALYRFACRYHSTGPHTHLFIDGFSEMPDKFSDLQNPESSRRQTYRYQVSPREKNAGWDLIEADFTPDTLKKTTPPVRWLRVNLYIYLHAGDCGFSDVVIKRIAPPPK